MTRSVIILSLFSLSLLLLGGTLPLSAQDAAPTGTGICIRSFEDRNGNAVLDTDEPPLPGISVNLATADDVIIATHITGNQTDPYCFQNLNPGTYTVIFADSANHTATTQNRGTLDLSAGQQPRVSFGAQPQEPLPLLDAAPTSDSGTQISTSSRILLGLLGAVIVMVFMIGLGAVIISLIS